MSGVVEAVGDFVSNTVGSVADAVSNTVSSIADVAGPVLPIVSQVAATIPGPWQIPAIAYNVASAASKGNIIGAALSAYGGYNALGGSDWFAAPVTSAEASAAWASMPVEAQQAYLNAGYSAAEIGTKLAQDQAYQAAFAALPIEAQTAYLTSGANPSAIGSTLLTEQSRNAQLWNSLPNDARNAYLAAGYTPQEIGSALATEAAINAGSSSGGLLSGVKTAYDAAKAINAVGGITPAGMLAAGSNLLGGYLNQQAGKDAAMAQAAATVDAARIAAEAAKFRPVGVTTRFGSSRFGTDAAGNVTSAGYTLSPEMLQQQNLLMGLSNTALGQYAAAPAATYGMGTAADRMMTLGNQYLTTSPQEQAQKYMAEQQALLAPSRERELAALENSLRARGMLGMATGATSTGMGAANPELEAFANAKRMQDLQLAAQATQGGQQYAQFGGALTGLGGEMLKNMYGTQVAAYAPYQTALGGATTIEGLGQQAMEQGINIGAKGTAASAASGGLLAQGMTNAAQIVGQQAQQAGSPWGNLLTGAGNYLQNTQQQMQQQQYNNALLGLLGGSAKGIG